MLNEITMTSLSKTWIFDIDGTIVKHNGYKTDGVDSLLEGAKEYIDSIPPEDFILFLTSRTDEFKEKTIGFLRENDIRYDDIIFNVPMGERIVVNDRKPSGADMAYAFNNERNCFDMPEIKREL